MKTGYGHSIQKSGIDSGNIKPAASTEAYEAIQPPNKTSAATHLFKLCFSKQQLKSSNAIEYYLINNKYYDSRLHNIVNFFFFNWSLNVPAHSINNEYVHDTEMQKWGKKLSTETAKKSWTFFHYRKLLETICCKLKPILPNSLKDCSSHVFDKIS